MELERIVAAGKSALRAAFETHERLGAAGIEAMGKNQFGESTLRGDYESEEAVMNALKSAQLPIRIIAEEHQDTDLAGELRWLGVLDGLDGTSVYKKSRGEGRYGTMLSIFSSIDPAYADYAFCGVMEHSTGRLVYAAKGKGCHILSVQSGKEQRTQCSGASELDLNRRTPVDIGVDRAVGITLLNDTFWSRLAGFNLEEVPSTAAAFVNLCSGKVDLVLDATRKRNLEFASAYGLVNEAGGVMVDLGCKDIGDRKYLEWGQKEHIPVVAAATAGLAQKLIKRIS